MIINLIIDTIICILTIISNYFNSKAAYNHKKIKIKLNAIENNINNNLLEKSNLKQQENDEIKALFTEFENKFQELLTKQLSNN